MTTTAIFFPFDLFGSTGCGAGAELLAEAFAELLADNRRERTPTRAAAYRDRVRSRRVPFETVADYRSWRERGRRVVRRALRSDAFLLWVAGNHLGVLPVYDELARAAADTLVIQFDAHLDIQEFTDSLPQLSHGNFLLHCDGTLPAIINVGHRDLLLRPEHVARYYCSTFSAEALARDEEAVVNHLRKAAGTAERVFLDFDCDALDPVFFPAVSHPLPFGLSPRLLLRLLDAVWSERIAGVALSEFDPGRDCNDQSLGTLVWLLEYLLLKRHEGKGGLSGPKKNPPGA